MSDQVYLTKLDKKPHPFRTAQEAELAYENGIVASTNTRTIGGRATSTS